MSIRVIQWVWDHSQAGGADRLVLLAIADNANHDGSDAWPSVEELSRKARVSERTVQRCIGNLEALGELVVERNAGGSRTTPGNRRPNRYAVIMQGCQSVTPVTDAGVTPVQPGVTSATSRGDTGVTQTVLNRPDPSESERARASELPHPHPLPPDWTPQPQHRALCITHGWDVDHEADRFRSHSRMTGRKLQDWDAAFDSWLTNPYPNKPADPRTLPPEERAEREERAEALRKLGVLALEAGDVHCVCGGVLDCIDEEFVEGRCRECGATACAALEAVSP